MCQVMQKNIKMTAVGCSRIFSRTRFILGAS